MKSHLVNSCQKKIPGEIRFVYKGKYPERFMELCRRNNISLKDIRMNKDDEKKPDIIRTGRMSQKKCMEATVDRKAYNQVLEYGKKTGGDILLLNTSGVYRLYWDYRKRVGMAVGAILMVSALFFLQSILWDVEIIGNEQVSEEEIMKYLDGLGVNKGVHTSYIDGDVLEKRLRTHFEQLVWVSAYKTGSVLNIAVYESYQPEIAKIETKPYHIVSDIDGTITSIVTRAGTPKVKSGDVVTKGQVLISGIVEYHNDAGEITKEVLVNSDGDIYGETQILYQEELVIDDAIRQEAMDQNVEIIKYGANKMNQQFDEYLKNMKKMGIQIIDNNVTIEAKSTRIYMSGTLRVVKRIGTIEFLNDTNQKEG